MAMRKSSSPFQGLGFRVWGLGLGAWGLGLGAWGLGFGVWGLGFGFGVSYYLPKNPPLKKENMLFLIEGKRGICFCFRVLKQTVVSGVTLTRRRPASGSISVFPPAGSFLSWVSSFLTLLNPSD